MVGAPERTCLLILHVSRFTSSDSAQGLYNVLETTLDCLAARNCDYEKLARLSLGYSGDHVHIYNSFLVQ